MDGDWGSSRSPWGVTAAGRSGIPVVADDAALARRGLHRGHPMTGPRPDPPFVTRPVRVRGDDLARQRRGGVRPPAPMSMTATAILGCSPRVGDEPGVGVRGIRGRVGGRDQLGGAGLAGDLRARQRGRDAGARCGRPRASSRAPGAATAAHDRRRRARVAAHDPRPHAHAAVGDRRADARHRQRRGEVAVLADRAGADREVVLELVRRDRAPLGARDRRLLVEPERLGGGGRAAWRRAARRAERRPSCTSARTSA